MRVIFKVKHAISFLGLQFPSFFPCLRKPFKEADFHLNLHGWSKDVILDSGERDVAYCVNPGRNLASLKPDGDEWAKVILLDFVDTNFQKSIRVQVWASSWTWFV